MNSEERIKLLRMPYQALLIERQDILDKQFGMSLWFGSKSTLILVDYVTSVETSGDGELLSWSLAIAWDLKLVRWKQQSKVLKMR